MGGFGNFTGTGTPMTAANFSESFALDVLDDDNPFAEIDLEELAPSFGNGKGKADAEFYLTAPHGLGETDPIPAEVPDLERFPLSDAGNAELLAALHGHEDHSHHQRHGGEQHPQRFAPAMTCIFRKLWTTARAGRNNPHRVSLGRFQRADYQVGHRDLQ